MTAVGGCGSMSGGVGGGGFIPRSPLRRSLACVYNRAKKVQVTVF